MRDRSNLPKSTNRLLRDYAVQIDQHREGLLKIRSQLVEDIEEKEAELIALNKQLADVDKIVQSVPTIGT